MEINTAGKSRVFGSSTGNPVNGLYPAGILSGSGPITSGVGVGGRGLAVGIAVGTVVAVGIVKVGTVVAVGKMIVFTFFSTFFGWSPEGVLILQAIRLTEMIERNIINFEGFIFMPLIK